MVEKMKNKGSAKPNYRYYALPVIIILSAIFFVIGILVAIFLWLIAGFILVGFGIYLISSYGISLLLMDQTKASELPKKIEMKGNERVLDVGCGLGKMTVGIAKVLEKGKVIDIDIWNKWEIMGNSSERAYENARIEGVIDKVEFKYGDMLSIPFAAILLTL